MQTGDKNRRNVHFEVTVVPEFNSAWALILENSGRQWLQVVVGSEPLVLHSKVALASSLSASLSDFECNILPKGYSDRLNYGTSGLHNLWEKKSLEQPLS